MRYLTSRAPAWAIVALVFAACNAADRPAPTSAPNWDALAVVIVVRSIASTPGGVMRAPTPAVLCVSMVGPAHVRARNADLLAVALAELDALRVPVRPATECEVGAGAYDLPVRERVTGRPAALLAVSAPTWRTDTAEVVVMYQRSGLDGATIVCRAARTDRWIALLAPCQTVAIS